MATLLRPIRDSSEFPGQILNSLLKASHSVTLDGLIISFLLIPFYESFNLQYQFLAICARHECISFRLEDVMEGRVLFFSCSDITFWAI